MRYIRKRQYLYSIDIDLCKHIPGGHSAHAISLNTVPVTSVRCMAAVGTQADRVSLSCAAQLVVAGTNRHLCARDRQADGRVGRDRSCVCAYRSFSVRVSVCLCVHTGRRMNIETGKDRDTWRGQIMCILCICSKSIYLSVRMSNAYHKRPPVRLHRHEPHRCAVTSISFSPLRPV